MVTAVMVEGRINVPSVNRMCGEGGLVKDDPLTKTLVSGGARGLAFKLKFLLMDL